MINKNNWNIHKIYSGYFNKHSICDILRLRKYEYFIVRDPYSSFSYARYILRDRFELGESVIGVNEYCAFSYARDIIKGRFELGEGVISKSPYYSYLYAGDIIRGRFELGESVIAESKYKRSYEERFNCKL